MIKRLTIIFLLFTTLGLNAQNEGNIWYFGYYTGIDFNGFATEAISDSEMETFEGCASVCDNMGNLLFYTNGVKVWNKLHEVMPNGTGLFGNQSSSQSALIVKKPGLNAIYYIFTTDMQAGVYGLHYSQVDLSLDGGLGDVNENKNVYIVSRTLEKVTAIRQDNYSDYWIVTHLWDSVRFHSYELTEAGFNMTPVISDVGSHIAGNGYSAMGYQKANQDGDRLAAAHGGFIFDVEIFDFDKNTGQISNPIILDGYILDKPYGIEFSPDGKLLYASVEGAPGTIYQYNLEAGNEAQIKASRQVVGFGLDYGGAIQLAPDGKIYHAGWNEKWLAVIENPNVLGPGCAYKLDGIYLNGNETGIGLPSFTNSFLKEPAVSSTNVCSGDSTLFTINLSNSDSVSWNFGDVDSEENNFSTLIQPSHYYENTGIYIVTLTRHLGSSSEDYQFLVETYSYPDISLGNDTLICQYESRFLDATTHQGYYQWQDLSSDSYYEATLPGNYWVNVIANSCITSDSLYLEACLAKVEMPNVFTPNNDSKNDFFAPVLASDTYNSTIVIYNRWGKSMYENNDIIQGWDGNFNGAACPEGNYFYVLTYEDIVGRQFQLKGHLSLLR